MGEVKALRGHPITIPDGQADPHIVEALEELLEKAKAGQIRGFAWCTYKPNDRITNGWFPGAYGFHLAAAIMSLHHDYSSQLSGNDVG